jgi:hypothetical protein
VWLTAQDPQSAWRHEQGGGPRVLCRPVRSLPSASRYVRVNCLPYPHLSNSRTAAVRHAASKAMCFTRLPCCDGMALGRCGSDCAGR